MQLIQPFVLKESLVHWPFVAALKHVVEVEVLGSDVDWEVKVYGGIL